MEHTERGSRGRFRLSLLQLVLVTLTVGTIGWLNLGFGVDVGGVSFRGWPARFRSSDGRYSSNTSWIETVGPEAEVVRQVTYVSEFPAGSPLPPVLMNLLAWVFLVYVAWVIGDPPSVSRTARDRLRKWRRSAKLA